MSQLYWLPWLRCWFWGLEHFEITPWRIQISAFVIICTLFSLDVTNRTLAPRSQSPCFIALCLLPKHLKCCQNRGCRRGISREETQEIWVCENTKDDAVINKWGVEKAGVSHTDIILITTEELLFSLPPLQGMWVSTGSCPSAALLVLLKHVDPFIICCFG